MGIFFWTLIRAVSEGDISLVKVKVANADLGGLANICEPLVYMNHPVLSGIKKHFPK